ncbi:MAG: SPASM domain-containing protein [Carboxydocellales bacterium]
MDILHNGDITGCTSIRDRKYIEGNIRNTPLKEIWQQPDSFGWNQQLTKERLEGFCVQCRFGEKCLGRLCQYKALADENSF